MNMNKTCRFCLLIGLCLLATCSPSSGARRSRYLLQWQIFDCVNHWPIASNISCRIEKNSKLSSELYLSEPIREVWVKYKFVVTRPVQNTDTVLFESSFDACQLLRDGIMANRLVLYIYQNMIKDSNLGQQCPLSQGMIYFHNIDAMQQLPALMPEMNFTLSISYYSPNTTDGIDVTLKGSVTERNRERYKFWQ